MKQGQKILQYWINTKLFRCGQAFSLLGTIVTFSLLLFQDVMTQVSIKPCLRYNCKKTRTLHLCTWVRKWPLPFFYNVDWLICFQGIAVFLCFSEWRLRSSNPCSRSTLPSSLQGTDPLHSMFWSFWDALPLKDFFRQLHDRVLDCNISLEFMMKIWLLKSFQRMFCFFKWWDLNFYFWCNWEDLSIITIDQRLCKSFSVWGP